MAFADLEGAFTHKIFETSFKFPSVISSRFASPCFSVFMILGSILTQQ